MPTYGQNMTFNYPGYNPQPQTSYSPYSGGYSGGGGGGWMQDALGSAGTGAALGSVIPGIGTLAGAGIGAGLSLLGGLFGGASKSKKDKKYQKALSEQQRKYQAQFGKLFPELSRESFQFQSPLDNSIQSALMYRMGNMFGNWGMPPSMRQGQDTMQGWFSQAMPGYNPAPGQGQASIQGQPPAQFQAPAPPQNQARRVKPRQGGWYSDFRKSKGRQFAL